MGLLADRLGTQRRGRLSGLRQWLGPTDRAWLEVRLWVDLQPDEPSSGQPALSGFADVLRARILAVVEATHLAVLQAIRQTRPSRFSESILLELACERMERLAIHQDTVWRSMHAEFEAAR